MLHRAKLAGQRAATQLSAAAREAASNVFTTPDLGGGKKQVFIWVQDESVAKRNKPKDTSIMRAGGELHHRLPSHDGGGLMVSDFCGDEGWLKATDEDYAS